MQQVLRWFSVWFLGTVVFWADRAWAGTPLLAAPGFAAERWDTADGLPINHLLGAAVDGSGTLWLATLDGLVRFDGVDFHTLRPGSNDGPPSSSIQAVHTHPVDGALWVISQAGVLQRRLGSSVTTFDQAELRAFLAPPSPGEEALWMVTESGLVRLDDVPTLQETPEAANPTAAITTPSGEVWVASHRGAVHARAETGGPWRRLGDVRHGEWVREAATGQPVSSGSDWQHRLFVDLATHTFSESDRRPERAASHPPAATPWALVGRSLRHDGVEVLVLEQKDHALLDHGEAVWLASQGEGLIRVRPTALTTHRAPDGAATNAQRLWWDAPTGTLWAQGRTQGWWPLTEGAVALPEVPEAETSCRGQHVRWFRDHDGLWLACERRLLHRSEAWTAHPLPGFYRGGPVWRSEGGLYLSGENSELMRRTGEQWLTVQLEGHQEGEVLKDVLSYLPLPDGSLLVGGARGVHRVDGLQATPVGALRPRVRHLRSDGARVWLGTLDHGLCVVPLDALDGLVDRCLGPGSTLDRATIHHTLADGRGRTWVATNQGIGVVADAALADWADGGSEPAVFWLDRTDGMRSAECNGFMGDAAVQTPDGHLWFATQDGVVEVDLDQFELPAPPAARWASATVGEAEHVAPDTLELVSDHAPVVLRWTAPVGPWSDQIAFRYRLSDDRPWSEPRHSRRLELASLPAGPSRVSVQARMGGRWGPAATLVLHRAPALHERGVFPLMLGLVGLGVLLVGVVARNRVQDRLKRRLEAQVAEQTERLAEQNQRLEDRNAQLAETSSQLQQRNLHIAAQARRLTELDALKRQLIANVSHELRTPLSLILAPLGALSADLPADSRHRRHIGVAMDSARQLDRLIAQLFDLSRVQAGGLRLQVRQVDLGRLVEDVRQRFEVLAEEAGVAVTAELPETSVVAWVGRDLVDKVLGNLAANALRHSPAGSRILLSLSTDDDFARIRVEDEGPGVPLAHRGAIFERFVQLEGEGAAPGGTGLGLSLAKDLVELHGGAIGVEDGAVGACFWFTLPLGVAHFAPEEVDAEDGVVDAVPTMPARDFGLAGSRLLLVEDHPQLRAYLAEVLAEHFDVTTAEDSTIALDLSAALTDTDGSETLSLTLSGVPAGATLSYCAACRARVRRDRRAGAEPHQRRRESPSAHRRAGALRPYRDSRPAPCPEFGDRRGR